MAEKHDLKIDEKTLDVNLYNNQKSPIDADTFSIIVRQYQNDCNFFIEIEIGGANAWTISTEVNSLQSISLQRFHFVFSSTYLEP